MTYNIEIISPEEMASARRAPRSKYARLIETLIESGDGGVFVSPTIPAVELRALSTQVRSTKPGNMHLRTRRHSRNGIEGSLLWIEVRA
jgi:hypothetical protein